LGTSIKYPPRTTSRGAGNGLRRAASFAAGNGLGTTINHLRRTTSGAAGNGLGTSFKYLCGAAGNNLGAMTKYLRCAKSGARDNGLGTTIEYLRQTAIFLLHGVADVPIHNKRLVFARFCAWILHQQAE
jgi:hypothetical protein